MKKIIAITLMLFSFTFVLNAQTRWYRTTAFAQATVYNGNYSWGDWEVSNMKMSIDWTNYVITIYSPKTQCYVLTDVVNTYTDKDGAEQIKFKGIDQDSDKCTIRFRVCKDGTSQLYINFSNIAWVYNVSSIN